MSRVGLKPIKILDGVTVEVKDGGTYHYKEVVVTGPKGTLTESVRRGVSIEIKDSEVLVSRDNDSKQNKAFHGLYRALINNMINGVVNGYSKDLEIVGIGYRAEMQGENVIFSIGYSHKINYAPPAGITISVAEQTKVKVEGIDRQLVGEVAAKIRAFKKPEPYKGKGIRYSNEIIKRKSAKSAGA